jgi:hypothetical protein
VKKECKVGAMKPPLPHCLLVRPLLLVVSLFLCACVLENCGRGSHLFMYASFHGRVRQFFTRTHACVPLEIHMFNPSVSCVHVDNYCL